MEINLSIRRVSFFAAPMDAREQSSCPSPNAKLTTMKKKKKKKISDADIIGSLETHEIDGILSSLVEIDVVKDVEFEEMDMEDLQSSISELSFSMEGDDAVEDSSAKPVNKSITDIPPKAKLSRFRIRSDAVRNSGDSPLKRPHKPPPPTPTLLKKVKQHKQNLSTTSLYALNEKETKKASKVLRRQLLQENALSSSSLYRSRRYTVVERSKPISPLQLEAERLLERRQSASFEEDRRVIFKDQKKRLRDVFHLTIDDEWRTTQFRQFLQQNHNDTCLEFYELIKRFRERAKDKSVIDKDNENYLQQREDHRAEGREICLRFLSDVELPSSVRLTLKDAWNLLTPILGEINDPEEFECLSDISVDLTDSETDHSESDEFSLDELDNDTMELLDTSDVHFLSRVYSTLWSITSITSHLNTLQSNTLDNSKCLEQFAFFCAERKIYSILLFDLFPEFLCSHSHIFNIERDSVIEQTAPSQAGGPAVADVAEEGSPDDVTTVKSESSPATDIIYGETINGKQIDACTIKKTIETLLVDPVNAEMDFQFVVFSTIFYFSSLEQIIEEIQALVLSLVATLDKKDPCYAMNRKKKIIPLIVRITSGLRMMFDLHAELFKRNPEDYSFLLNYINQDIKPEMETPAQTLKDFIIKRMKQVTSEQLSDLQFNTKAPKCKITKSLLSVDPATLSMSLLHPLEMARQITILDHQLYKAISLEECLHMRWTKKEKCTLAPNVIGSIHQFCNLGNWVVSQIVSEYDMEKRASILLKMVSLAYFCFQLQNFNGAMAVISGLQNHCSFRLKLTWAAMPDKGWDMWEELKDIFKCDENFATLRAATSKSQLPAIPYLGMYLSDLTFIDNESNFIDKEKKMINFVKMSYIGRVMRQIEKYQQGGFNLTEIGNIQKYLLVLPLIEEKEMYSHSTKCEAKKGPGQSRIQPAKKKRSIFSRKKR